uniref:Uncharacterized protein n=1 Tax=Sus scrofa TaxID=9823 RepID=A0A4X1TKT1_PIG
MVPLVARSSPTWITVVILELIHADGGRPGHSYCAARGEILGPAQDGPERKHLPRMFSLIKNESRRFEDDQIPS